MSNLIDKLKISDTTLKTINDFLLDPENPLIKSIFEIINKYGTPEEINAKAKEAGKLENLMKRLKEKEPSYYANLEWLIEQKEKGAFIKQEDYYKKVLGDKYESTKMKEGYAITLELSALQFFPFFMKEAKYAIEHQELMPGRYIKVRNMLEQVEDGQLLATSCAMRIIGSSYVETLDTKGTDGSNVHLGGPETITGYFGGIGQPNTHALKWLDEFLHYYTEYGVQQVLNINPGTILIGYMLHKIGIDIEFKISVYMGNDNPYSVLWTMLTAKLFAREDGTTPLIGFNFSNSVNNETIELAAIPRKAFGFEDFIRIEHHIFETWKSIVRQPYDRRAELVEVAAKVRNISAKHEGGDIEVEEKREHPSDILEYFLSKEDINKQGIMDFLTINYMDKHDSITKTADALIKAGIPVICAQNLH